eukprot:scaffold3600_cov387-Prasinococcus_capsulatus_cf.AAC.12
MLPRLRAGREGAGRAHRGLRRPRRAPFRPCEGPKRDPMGLKALTQRRLAGGPAGPLVGRKASIPGLG